MDRRTFVKAGCLACLGITTAASLLESCTAVRYAKAKLNDDGLLVDPKEFETKHKGKLVYRNYVIIHHEELKYPICIYRIDETEYSALLMKCTHQGAELQVSGDQLTCPSHGSEFDKAGIAMQGPATELLRSFPVTMSNGKLFIDLRIQS